MYYNIFAWSYSKMSRNENSECFLVLKTLNNIFLAIASTIPFLDKFAGYTVNFPSVGK